MSYPAVTHQLSSRHQGGDIQVKVLLPSSGVTMDAPVLYILPVHAGSAGTYGDGLAAARKAGVADRYGIVCVQPEFLLVPWYGDHATDPQVRQESFMRDELIPFIDCTYSTRAQPDARWLIGFSKSGWGAYTLLMRNAGTFGYAAGWDVPFMIDGTAEDWGPLGLSEVYGTAAAMRPCVPTVLAREHADYLRKRLRLVLGPGEDWDQHTVAYHQLLTSLRIPHRYRADRMCVHRWDSGWFALFVDELVAIAHAPTSQQ
jgi:hypothetical protein